MSKTFIAGFDGSDGARAAVQFARRLADAMGAEVVAVTGYSVPHHVFGKGAGDGPDAALAADARAAAEAAAAELRDGDIASRIVGSGGPAQALVEQAEALEADLIVVGRHEAAGLERLRLGSTAERVAHGSPCPVAIVPPDADDAPLGTIAVAYDGREPAEAALEYAAGLARSFSARLVLIAVVEPFTGSHWQTAEYEGRYRAAIADRADSAAEALRPEVEVEVRMPMGAAGEAIVAACADGVDLLVTGSRAYGPAHAALVGSVSHHLAAHTVCPVIVVPRQVRQPSAAA